MLVIDKRNQIQSHDCPGRGPSLTEQKAQEPIQTLQKS